MNSAFVATGGQGSCCSCGQGPAGPSGPAGGDGEDGNDGEIFVLECFAALSVLTSSL